MSVGESHGYQVGAVATATPARLVTMLYDAALAAIGRARHQLAQGDAAALDSAHREMTRAQDILLELQLSLDHELGGEIARNLGALYEFCLDRLVRANIDKDPRLLGAVERVIEQLRDGWAAASLAAETS